MHRVAPSAEIDSLEWCVRTSHVTRHTSHVTGGRTSDAAAVQVIVCIFVSRRKSRVRRHTSQLTRHTSQLTRHKSHVTRHTSHVTLYTPGHQMHFDLDEPYLISGGGLRHPVVSAVVYLTHAGSPTLVTSLHVRETPSAAAEPSSASEMSGVLCPPSLGRALLFDGGLLHVRHRRVTESNRKPV